MFSGFEMEDDKEKTKLKRLKRAVVCFEGLPDPSKIGDMQDKIDKLFDHESDISVFDIEGYERGEGCPDDLEIMSRVRGNDWEKFVQDAQLSRHLLECIYCTLNVYRFYSMKMKSHLPTEAELKKKCASIDMEKVFSAGERIAVYCPALEYVKVQAMGNQTQHEQKLSFRSRHGEHVLTLFSGESGTLLIVSNIPTVNPRELIYKRSDGREFGLEEQRKTSQANEAVFDISAVTAEVITAIKSGDASICC